ncbi:GNAT family N-acetyltransferase [Mycobacterium shigaense]|uniref:Acyl-CoA synthetase n=1 Tax=Mycobacterium shigaense TaxID=722731 RepID=A0A1Z4EJ60_9MYCO|nr:GNAT family N-acetyltransferase [Mycobacterium shigaense]MEA1124037.1 GNAT family N-acetyltransferase [Mycobacterium shigaense]BAX92946.1 acyl-CoA synthetase [Mycobacterium shigaense]
MSDQPAEFAATARLLDGRRITLRRLGADDADAILALHQHLSDRDRYFRFFTLNPIDLRQLITKMTEPAQGWYALGAFDGHRLIGVANYVVTPDDPQVAEIAATVAHENHSLGAGTALLEHLARIARTDEVKRFVADVLCVNDLMLKVLADIGLPCTSTDYGTVRHLEIELPDGLDEKPTIAEAIA